MAYDKNRKGYVTSDGKGLIRAVRCLQNTRVDIYIGNERERNNHKRFSIYFNPTTRVGKIRYHNEDKSVRRVTDISCYLTTACMRYQASEFNDQCIELRILRWFREHFVSDEDIDYYKRVAPIIVQAIQEQESAHTIFCTIYQEVILPAVICILNKQYKKAYDIYKKSVLELEESYAKPHLVKKLVNTLRHKNTK